MGMVWVARLASDEDLSALRLDPDGAADFIDSDEAYESGQIFDVDKQWHGVHHMLTGSADAIDSPLSLILGDFEEIGPDNGYGPAWIVPSSAFQACNQALQSLSDDDLKARFDPEGMERDEIYLGEMFKREGDEAFGFLLEDIHRLKEFVANAASQSLHAVAMIS